MNWPAATARSGALTEGMFDLFAKALAADGVAAVRRSSELTHQLSVEVASRLIRDVGCEPVLIGGLEMGKHLMPGTALAGERSAEEIRKIAAGLN